MGVDGMLNSRLVCFLLILSQESSHPEMVFLLLELLSVHSEEAMVLAVLRTQNGVCSEERVATALDAASLRLSSPHLPQ